MATHGQPIGIVGIIGPPRAIHLERKREAALCQEVQPLHALSNEGFLQAKFGEWNVPCYANAQEHLLEILWSSLNFKQDIDSLL